MRSRVERKPAEPAASQVRGTNQAGMRARNERLVLSLVRRHGALAKTEIARMTGLSAQTVSVIMRRLEADRLLRRGEPQRGRVGQPSVPLSLDPEGAYFVGAKVGRRSLEIVLVDFAGTVRWRIRRTNRYPAPCEAAPAIAEGVAAVEALLGAAAAERIAGIGIAAPFALRSRAGETGAPEEEMAAWRDTDLRADLAARLPYPVYVQNEATAACGAELAFGTGADLSDFLYLHVGAFVGGGLVLNGGLFAGRTGNAAALGAMPVQDAGGRMAQLIDVASLVVLERRLRAAEVEADGLFDPSGDWSAFEPHLGRWIDEAGRGMARAIASTAAVIDIEAALVDGPVPADVRARLLVAIETTLAGFDLSGIAPPSIRAGALGPVARALGGASLPLFDRYLTGQHALRGVSGAPQAQGHSKNPAGYDLDGV